MNRSRADRYLLSGWLIISVFFLFRLAFTGTMPLVPDEAYYWQWSRHPAWGYHDHPPVIAWLIAAATRLLGHTETAVRLPVVCAQAIACIYLFQIAARWMSSRVAFYTVLLTQSILGFNAAGILATPDTPLLTAWAGGAYHLARAYDDGDSRQWLMGGAWFGFGMLSKYTMAIFPLLVFLPGLLSPRTRRQLARPWPYAGLLLGCLMFLPVILWNIDNHWSTLRHAAHKGGVDQGFTLQLNYLADFVISQIGLLSPLVFVLLIAAWYYALTRPATGETWIFKYLLLTSFPLAALFAILSLHTRVEGNWAAPAYLTGSILIGARMDPFGRRPSPGTHKKPMPRLWPWALLSSYLITGLIFIHAARPILPLPVKLDRIAKETGGWHELGQRVARMKQAMPHPERTFIFGLNYQTASELAFYAPGRPQTVAINKWTRPNAYEYWRQDADLKGWDAVGVGSASPKNTERLKQIFNQVAEPERLDIRRKRPLFLAPSGDPPVAAYYLYRAFGFKGGIRWMPKDLSDIRAETP